MIAPQGWNVTIEDVIYRDGYRDAEGDTIKRIVARLWEKKNLIEKAAPELALGIVLAIEEIEAISDY